MKQDLRDIILGEERQEAANVRDKVVFGPYFKRYEVVRSVVGIVLSLISQATLVASR